MRSSEVPFRVGRSPVVRSRTARSRPLTLAVDVGGTAIKSMLLDGRGRPASVRRRMPTPEPATPAAVLDAVRALATELGPMDRVGVGFPGVVQGGRVRAAPNLRGPGWKDYALRTAWERAVRTPVRVANDAVVHGLGAVRGKGVEMMLTLGTGLGSALFVDGRAVPLELGHLRWIAGTYEDRIGESARKRIGTRRWSRLVARVLEEFRAAFRPDEIYVGGGNAARLPRAMRDVARLVDNDAGLLGAVRLWAS
jgi:polyphosphate glucokinase